MKKVSILSLAALFVLGTAAFSLADEAKPAEKPAAPHEAMAHESGAHEMSGKVTWINHKTGLLHLKTAPVTLKLHFPPASIKDVKKGEPLTVRLAFVKGTAPAEAGKGQGMGEHWMTGKIGKINHHTGVIHLTAAGHALVVHFHGPAIKDLKKGEEISVQLSYMKTAKK